MIWLYDNIDMRIEGTIIVRVSKHIDALRVEPRTNEGASFFIARSSRRAMSVSYPSLSS